MGSPGLDVVGTVVGHGEGVDQPPIGTRVFYHGRMLEPYGGLSPFSVHEASTLIPLRPSWSATMDAIVDGRVHVPVSRVITLEEAPGVLADMVHAHTRGKIVVRVDDDEAVSPVEQRADGKVVDSPSTNKSTRMTAVCGVTITDREQFDSLVQDMIKLERTTPGTLQLEWFVDEENPAEAVLLESFENEEAQLQHMKNFSTFRDRFGCMHFHTFRYFGAVTPSVRERIAKHPFKFYQTAAELRR